jgi:hypothetical protein
MFEIVGIVNYLLVDLIKKPCWDMVTRVRVYIL